MHFETDGTPPAAPASAPSFIFLSVGSAPDRQEYLAKRGRLEPGSSLFGQAFENWVFHELTAYSQYRGESLGLSFWRLSTGTEVDFIIDDARCAIEAKASATVHADHLKGLRELVQDHPRVQKRVVVSLDARPRRTEDGIEILPYRTFVGRLWDDDLIR